MYEPNLSLFQAAGEVPRQEGRGPLHLDVRGGGVGVDHQEGNAAHHRQCHRQGGGTTRRRGGGDRGHENADK